MSNSADQSALRGANLEGSLRLPRSHSRLAARLGKKALYAAFATLTDGEIALVDEHGERREFGEPSALLPGMATITVDDPRFWGSLAQGVVGAGEAYMAGHWHCDDLALLTRILVRNDPARASFDGPLVKVSEPLRRLLEWIRGGNSIVGTRRSIRAHYDLGNDFFELFLDPSLTYSAGIFEREDASMEEASLAKYERLCRKLDLRPGDHLLEIGTGWGGMALHAAGKYGCRVTTTTVSAEQHERASERVEEARLSDRVTVLLEDYRDLSGRYDKLVSIEMIEAVGHEFFDTYFRVCSERLEPHGLMALQAIAIRDDEYERARRTVDFVRKHIFPGGSIPSLQVIGNCVATSGDMKIVHLEDMTPHYVTTLRRWREKFLANREKIAALGYSEDFLRMWEFYLAYCEGGFDAGRCASVQLLLAKPQSQRPPVMGSID
jgi:cyclopropane-fatty-acyl-phospholipid synthase